MTLNGIDKIKDEAGDYIVLSDYGSEGIAVSYQCDTAEGAVQWMMMSGHGQMAVVKLVQFNGEKP